MRFGIRKLLAVLAAALVFSAATVAAWQGWLEALLVLVIVVQLAGSALLGQLIMGTRRETDRRLRQLEHATAATLRSVIGEERFVETLRSAALPQQHADQLLRTIDARHARLETMIEQLAGRLDRDHEEQGDL